MATVIAPFVAVDGNGHVRASAKLYFYETGTSTPQATYSDSALSVTNTNPVVANSDGLFSAIYLGEAPDFEAYKAILKDSNDVTIWTTDPIAGAPIAAPITAALLRGYISGLQRTANTGTTLSVGAGVCADDTNTSMLQLAAGTINCATVGADGLDAGALAVTTSYHAFAIGKTDGTVARLASTSPSSPTMPSGYTLKRRVMSFKTTVSSQIVDFVQDGDWFHLATPIREFTDTNPGISAVTKTLSTIPTGVRMGAIAQPGLSVISSTNTVVGYFSDLSTNDIAPTTTGVYDGNNFSNQAGFAIRATIPKTIWTNTSAQIRYRISFSDAAITVTFNTHGWIDRRGRDG